MTTATTPKPWQMPLAERLAVIEDLSEAWRLGLSSRAAVLAAEDLAEYPAGIIRKAEKWARTEVDGYLTLVRFLSEVRAAWHARLHLTHGRPIPPAPYVLTADGEQEQVGLRLWMACITAAKAEVDSPDMRSVVARAEAVLAAQQQQRVLEASEVKAIGPAPRMVPQPDLPALSR